MSLSFADDKMVSGSELLDLYQEAGWGLLAARTPEQALKFLREDSDFWLPIIKASGATAE